MLNSRFVHLHEALGLGAMWLNQDARLNTASITSSSQISSPQAKMIEAENTANKHIPLQTTFSPKKSSASTLISIPANNARLAALQRVGSRTLTAATPQNSPIDPNTETSKTSDTINTNQPLTQLAKPISPAKVLALSVCASPADIAAGSLFSGEDGQLLSRMFAAIQLQSNDVHLDTWLSGLPDFNPKPPKETVIAATDRIQNLWQASDACAILLMGDFFERDDVRIELDKICPAQARFIIPHPLRILSNPKELRPIAWEVLQNLRDYLQQAA